MYIQLSYDQEFNDLWMHLKEKYPTQLFDMDGVGRQLDLSQFSKNFFSTKTTTADTSIDANANVDDISVIAYSTELKKPYEKLNSYYMLWKELKRLYGLSVANTIIEMQLNGDIYIHDFHGVGAGMPYCYNYSTYDIMVQGLSTVKKVTCKPPKYLYAFKSQIEQFVTIASNSTLGATGLADMLVIMAFYVEDILRHKRDAHFTFASEADCWLYIKENLVSMIYTINQPMRGNQCVTEDTEVLTPEGFKTYRELKIGDQIYTWNNGNLNVQNVQRVNVYDYDGIMHEYSGRDTIQTVTPNHRILHQKNNSSEYMLTPSSELINMKTPLIYPVATLEDHRSDYDISDDMLKLCVFILTDGSIDNQKRGRVSIYKSPNRWGNAEIQSVLNNLDLDYRHHIEPAGFGGTINHYDITTESSQEVLQLLNYRKDGLPHWFTKLSKRQANLVIDLWARFDGHTETGSYNKQKCQCDNYEIADQLQHVCFLAGRGSNITSRTIGDNKQETIYLIPYHRVNKQANKKRKIHYKGKVWCPSTQDGIVVFRKDGKIFISGNSPFTNLSVYDKYFLEKLCGDYTHPETGNNPKMEIVQKIQELFLDIMNEEMTRTPLTFPVVTACFSIDENNNIKDEEFLELIATKNLQFGFINIYSGKTSTLSSCCRLRSESDNEYFNSFGSGSSKIGSLGVCSINLPRLALKYKDDEDLFFNNLSDMIGVCARTNNAKRKIVKKRIDNGNHPLYDLGFIDLNRQYSTVGVNGFNECIEIMGYDILKDDGVEFGLKIIDTINRENKKYQSQYKAPHNVEQVPGENMSIKMANKDKLMGYQDKYDIYSNQFIPLVTNADMLDRIKLQGIFDSHFSGGSICHINIENQITDSKLVAELIRTATKMGVIYFAINYNLQRCENGHMSVGRNTSCEVCGAEITDNFIRVVGFLTNVKNWHKTRRELDYPNRQFYKGLKS